LSEKPLQGMRVLVMEDEYLIAMDVEQLCRDHGAEDVIILQKLEELGGNPIATHGFHAAIIDIRLGGETTLDFARQLAEQRVPFIIATGYSESETLLETFPDVTVVGKPYAGDALIEAIRGAIERQRESGSI
jgi:DNA-binding NarL/FixJ family response regulator